MTTYKIAKTPEEAVEQLDALYKASVERLQNALKAFLEGGKPPSEDERRSGAFVYPELRVTYSPDGPPPPVSRAFGKFTDTGVYASTITNPQLYRDYLIEQLSLLSDTYEITIETGPSQTEIPFSYVLDGADDLDMNAASPAELVRHFPYADLSRIDDELPNGLRPSVPGEVKPLSLFEAPRVDYSLQRLRHYTGTPYEDTQQFILFTNYHRYVDAFTAWAIRQLKEDNHYEAFSAAGNVRVDASTPNAHAVVEGAPWRRFQMPAYHLMAPGRRGITLVNIGVGPSNAKTITDHLAVLRPQCWLMIGH